MDHSGQILGREQLRRAAILIFTALLFCSLPAATQDASRNAGDATGQAERGTNQAESGSREANAVAQSGSSGGNGDSAATPAVPEEPGTVVTPDQRANPAVPDETDILLPNMLLRVREVELDRVAAALPDSPPVELPDLSGPLPNESGETELATQSIQLPDPGGPGFTAETQEQQASLFSRGVLGIGTMNHILGSLSLYRLGVDPRLRFEFTHEDYDGYQFHEPGDGYFRQINSLTGSVEASFPRWELSTEAAFNEREEGMQENDDFYSVKRREFSGTVRTSYIAADRLTLRGSVGGDAAQRIFAVRAAESSRRQEQVTLSSEFGADLTLEEFTGSLNLDYRLTALSSNTAHLFRPSLSGEYTFASSLFLAGEAGIAWDFGRYLRVPFSLELSGPVADVLTLTLRGGYSVEPFDMSAQWEQELLTGLPNDRPAPIERFFGQLSGTWRIIGDTLTMDAALEGGYAVNALDIKPFSTGSDTFPLVREPMWELRPRIGLNWRSGVFRLSAGWEADLIESPEWVAPHLLSATMELSEVAERLGGSLRAEMPIYSEPIVPRLSASAHVDLADGIRLVAEGTDLLAPVLGDEGRPTIGTEVTEDFPFIQPGFRFIIRTELSL